MPIGEKAGSRLSIDSAVMPMVSATSATNSAKPGALAVASAGTARTDMVMIGLGCGR